ncbi:hypothetical protein NA78x_004992 [Anatilimnocola sp. NA78]|uniref:hypothetical protein n=1 Tax=Anatilimnocola sp. NA78 TaxID=3415683 RepID=UPI003CE4ADF1
MSLLKYSGANVYDSLLAPWLERNGAEIQWLSEFRDRTNDNWPAATGEDLCRLYGMFRCTSLLLLSFQTARAGGTDYRGPSISLDDFQFFHQQLGFTVHRQHEFHPFFHEIVGVQRVACNSTPIQLANISWPCLMLGSLLYCRAGCSVSGGEDYVVKELAETSILHWTFRRKDRRCTDQSVGWGSNSQWRTAFRRDYLAAGSYHYNIDGATKIRECDTLVCDLRSEVMIELIRNRCFIKTRLDDGDLYPYSCSYAEIQRAD